MSLIPATMHTQSTKILTSSINKVENYTALPTLPPYTPKTKKKKKKKRKKKGKKKKNIFSLPYIFSSTLPLSHFSFPPNLPPYPPFSLFLLTPYPYPFPLPLTHTNQITSGTALYSNSKFKNF